MFHVMRLNGRKFTINPRNLEFKTDNPIVMYYDRETGEELATINLGQWQNEDFFLGVLKNRYSFPLDLE